ncbi:hypothetical protein GIB67_040635 [Kingdonia uniflora]|uniref:Uncharacterized protein n=1 Tax=Kingdonia uniflora TaxID=39325 RepID=A0A7J7M946_9MAGN|nr:hypothetical protein GIB67_040635 [Kingdonia uniflora]
MSYSEDKFERALRVKAFIGMVTIALMVDAIRFARSDFNGERDAPNGVCLGWPVTVAVKANHFNGLSLELAICPVILRPCIDMVEEYQLRRVSASPKLCLESKLRLQGISGVSILGIKLASIHSSSDDECNIDGEGNDNVNKVDKGNVNELDEVIISGNDEEVLLGRHFLGQMDAVCTYYSALHLKDEQLSNNQLSPHYLKNYMMVMDRIQGHFQRYMQEYNAANIFRSLGVHTDNQIPHGRGSSSFVFHKELHHRIGDNDNFNAPAYLHYSVKVDHRRYNLPSTDEIAELWRSGRPVPIAVKANHSDGLSGKLAVCLVTIRPCEDMVEECPLRCVNPFLRLCLVSKL